MLGNDIVDMKDERNLNRSGQKRFLDKLFTPSEQQLIATSDMPDHMVWVLWSIKESAYKVINRSTGIRSYAPLSYEVQLKSALIKGKLKVFSLKIMDGKNVSDVEFLDSSITVSGLKLFAKTLVAENFIHSLASSELSYLNLIKWKVEKTAETRPERQSHTIKELAKKHIAQNKKIELSEISILTDGVIGNSGPPLVQIKNKFTDKIDLSLSHDGPYLAYSYVFI